MQGDSPLVSPQFKTWLYIYKNNSVEKEYTALLADNYFVEVKEIDRNNYDIDENTLSDELAAEPIIAPVDNKEIDDAVETSTVTKPVSAPTSNNSKDIPDFETLKKNEPLPVDETRTESQKDASKFDEVVEDRQYVEVPVIKKEILKEQSEKDAEVKHNTELKIEASKKDGEPQAAVDKAKDDEPEVVAKVTEIFSKEPEKISLPLKQFEELEIMHAEESRFIGRAVRQL